MGNKRSDIPDQGPLEPPFLINLLTNYTQGLTFKRYEPGWKKKLWAPCLHGTKSVDVHTLSLIPKTVHTEQEGYHLLVIICFKFIKTVPMTLGLLAWKQRSGFPKKSCPLYLLPVIFFPESDIFISELCESWNHRLFFWIRSRDICILKTFFYTFDRCPKILIES